MRAIAAFSGIEILTYALMSNHLHLLIKVPDKCDLPEDVVLKRIKSLYGDVYVNNFKYELDKLRKEKRIKEANALLQKYAYRMHDLSQFMKMVMQRFTQSYNKRHNRRGTLWEDRFKSILIEGKADAIATMSAYIDLNAVRAGMVNDPKDYRFSGYGEAISGIRVARNGIKTICGVIGGDPVNWQAGSAYYRKYVFLQAEAHTKKGTTISREKIEQTLAVNGKLSRAELLHCKVRYLSDGVVLGSKTFVEDVFHKHRDDFGLKRTTGARKPRYGDWGSLCTMRDLRLTPVSISST
jgi:REP element-mobilizing transposase RayT